MFSKTILVGYVGREPEVRYTQSGIAVCNFTLATSEKFRVNNETKEDTQWHTVTCWRKLAEICGEHVYKGMLVAVEGKIKYTKWEDKNGETKHRTNIDAERVVFLSKKASGYGPEGQSVSGVDDDDIHF